MKSSRSNFDLRAPSSYLARSYLIATVTFHMKGGLISKGILIFFYPQEIRLLTKHHQLFGKEEMIFELMQI